MNKLNVLSLFSGIGAFEKALNAIGIDYNLINYCEIDKYASKAYSLIHNVSEDKNLKDVTTVDTSKIPLPIDLITYGSPCQDLSIAGNMKGFKDEETGNTTRSGLFFEALRIIEDTKPKYAIMENVKNLTSKRFETEFDIVRTSLDKAGYVNYWKVLNAKDYGIPQNRERVFIVSIRKDIDTFNFRFPKKIPLNKNLESILEDKVDEKYYYNVSRAYTLISKILEKYDIQHRVVTDGSIKDPKVKEIANCITARYDSGIQNQKSMGNVVVEPKIKVVGKDANIAYDYSSRIYDTEGLSPTLVTCSGGNQVPKIFKASELRIRKLTPKECFRLMGFDDKDVDVLIENGLSNSRLYKMAGNSIVVDVLEAIFRNLLEVEK